MRSPLFIDLWAFQCPAQAEITRARQKFAEWGLPKQPLQLTGLKGWVALHSPTTVIIHCYGFTRNEIITKAVGNKLNKTAR